MEEFLRRLLTMTLNEGKNRLELAEVHKSEIEGMMIFNVTCNYYNLEDPDSEPIKMESSLVVPTLINGMPVQNNKGRQKVTITAARELKTIKCYKNSVSIGANRGHRLYINFESEWVQLDDSYINLYSFLDYFGLYEKYFGESSEKIIKVTPEEEELINNYSFPTYVITKLRILFETKEVKNGLCSDTLDKILTVYKRPDLQNIVTPTDYGYYDVYSSLIQDLRDDKVFHKIRRGIIYKTIKNGNLYLTGVQSFIDNFFRMRSINFNSVQTGKDSNPLSLDVQSKRIYFYGGNYTDGFEKVQMYNNYFIGVLDPIKTQDGPNINYSNELPSNTKVIDSDIIIEVLNKEWKSVQISYDEYAISAILVEDQVDEVHHKITARDGSYVVYQFGKYHEVTSEDEIDYYRTIDGLTSPATAMVPFLNKTDSTRGMLGAHMIEQAIPVVGSKPSIVYTPESKKLFDRSALNIKSNYDGVVTGVYPDETMVKVKSDDGVEHVISSPGYENTVQSTTTKYYTDLKDGDRVKVGTPVFMPNSFKDEQFAIGVPLYAALTTYNGHDHEDGYVITESAAKKLAHPKVEQIIISLPNDGTGYFFSDEKLIERDRFSDWGIIKEGMGVNAGDILMEYYMVLNEYTNIGKIRLALGQDDTYVRDQVKVPAKIRNGIVKSVRFYHTLDDDSDTCKYYDKLAKEKQFNRNLFSGETTSADTTVSDSRYAYEIEIIIEYYLPSSLGSKLSNFYGSKGENAWIIPDELAPRDKDGRSFEVMFSPLSTYSRKNPSQIYEAKLGLVGVRGFELLEDWVNGNRKAWNKVNKLLSLIYEDYNGEEAFARSVYDSFKKYGYLRFEVTSFDKFYTSERIINALEVLGLGNGDMSVYFPEYNRWTNNNVTVGYITVMRLHFIAEDRATATSITRITSELPFGYGKVKFDGQKLGSQEVFAWMSHGKVNELAQTVKENEQKADKLFSTFLCLGMSIEED